MLAGVVIRKSHKRSVSCAQSPSCASVLAATDFAVFVFDSTSLASFRTAHQLMLAVAQAAGDALPCVFLAAKDDLGMSQVGMAPLARGPRVGSNPHFLSRCPVSARPSLQLES